MRAPVPSPKAGFSIIELMIAITVSLLVMVALSATFLGNSRARAEIERTNQQIENGRYAMQVLTDDLEVAGYYGQTNIANLGFVAPVTRTNPCSVDTNAANDGPLNPANLLMHIEGYDSGTVAIPACIGTLLAALDGGNTIEPGTDVVVIRRVSTCESGSADCAHVQGAPYFQGSLCQTHLNAATSEWFELSRAAAASAGAEGTNLDRLRRDCTTRAEMRQYKVLIYFIAANDAPPDGVETLKRLELTVTGGNLAFDVVPIAQGIQNMQLEYGIDAIPAAGDGIPEAFAASPDTYSGCATPACAAANWQDVLAVKVSLLARNTTATPDYNTDCSSPTDLDCKTYTLGLTAAGAPNVVGGFADGFKRHAYQTTVRLMNAAGRRE